MKKTKGIQLVLITAALAGCDKPLYQQGPEFNGPVYPQYESAANASPGYGTPPYGAAQADGPPPDSSNSCPMMQSQLPPDYYLWYDGLQPFNLNFSFGNWYPLEGYYSYRYPATVIRYGFGRTGHAHVGFAVHS